MFLKDTEYLSIHPANRSVMTRSSHWSAICHAAVNQQHTVTATISLYCSYSYIIGICCFTSEQCIFLSSIVLVLFSQIRVIEEKTDVKWVTSVIALILIANGSSARYLLVTMKHMPVVPI